MIIRLQFDSLPISDNKIYCNIFGQARRFLSSEAKNYKNNISSETIKQIKDIQKFVPALKGKPLLIFVDVVNDKWLIKSGSIRKIDVQNMGKALLDSVFIGLQTIEPDLDDSQIFSLNFYKSFPDETGWIGTRITIETLEFEHL